MSACCPTLPHGAVPAPLSLLPRWWSAWRDALWRRPDRLAGIRELDPRTLRDIGVCPGTLPAPELGTAARRGLDFP